MVVLLTDDDLRTPPDHGKDSTLEFDRRLPMDFDNDFGFENRTEQVYLLFEDCPSADGGLDNEVNGRLTQYPASNLILPALQGFLKVFSHY